MELNWRKLHSEDQLAEIDQLSKGQSVLIFKHSTRCAISAATLNRLERKWSAAQDGEPVPYFLDIMAFRSVSNAVAGHYQVPHESPQALIVRNGECIYHNSHFGISFDELMVNAKQHSV